MAKQYGTKSLFEKVFGGKLFPKGTGGILPKYDKALNKAKSETSIKNYKSNRAASDMMKAAEKKFAKDSEISKMKNMISAAKRDTAKTNVPMSSEAKAKARDTKKTEQAPKGTKFAEQKAPKKSLREKLTGFKTQKAFDDAKAKRKLKKRIATITKTLQKKDSKVLKERLAKLKAQL